PRGHRDRRRAGTACGCAAGDRRGATERAAPRVEHAATERCARDGERRWTGTRGVHAAGRGDRARGRHGAVGAAGERQRYDELMTTDESWSTAVAALAVAPLIAIVGRPNVGKSALFNRVTSGNRALVEDLPGTTRDRIYGAFEWNGRHVRVVDTGG